MNTPTKFKVGDTVIIARHSWGDDLPQPREAVVRADKGGDYLVIIQRPGFGASMAIRRDRLDLIKPAIATIPAAPANPFIAMGPRDFKVTIKSPCGQSFEVELQPVDPIEPVSVRGHWMSKQATIDLRDTLNHILEALELAA